MPLLPVSRRTIHLLDVLLVVWIVVWLLLAARLSNDVRSLDELAVGAVAAGGALTATADAIAVLDGIPFVDREVDRLETRVRDAGRRTTRAGRASRDEIETYAVLVRVTVSLGPTLPLLLLYLPLRIGWSRDRRAIRRLRDAGAPELRYYLARRALARADAVTFARSTSAGEPGESAIDALAAAELRRVGLGRRR